MKKFKRSKTINIGLFGLGTVGTGVAKILISQAKTIEEKTGARVVLKRVCVKSLGKKRQVRLPAGVLINNPDSILRDPAIDIVIELIGGIHPAKEIIRKALAAGKQVVTANKALLAEEGETIFNDAARASVYLGFEASVCGAIPIIKSIKEGLASDQVSHFLGIVNGTCNYILSSMSQEGIGFAEALKRARANGFAEKNPKLDIEGIDSAHKLAILARLAFRAELPFRSIYAEGIKNLSALDIAYAKELGYVIKLLTIGKKMKNGLELRVHPTMLPEHHPLASVRGVYNAVFLHAQHAGDLLFYGRGAGMFPTASAVMSDIIDIAGKMVRGRIDNSFSSKKIKPAHILSMDDVVSKYYLRFQAADRPGVLGRIAQTLGKNHISILSVHQKESHDSKSVPVVILTYEASEKDLRKALKLIDSDKDISQKTVVIRVEQ